MLTYNYQLKLINIIYIVENYNKQFIYLYLEDIKISIDIKISYDKTYHIETSISDLIINNIKAEKAFIILHIIMINHMIIKHVINI